jgi:methylase of polypeptide subunit release factors
LGCIGIGIDINCKALYETKAATKGKMVDLIQTSLMSCFAQRPVFDIIFCNPPYVPSEDLKTFRRNCQPIDLAWAGGHKGREVIDNVLNYGMAHLVSGGVMYLLITQQNEPDEIIELSRDLGYVCVVQFII